MNKPAKIDDFEVLIDSTNVYGGNVVGSLKYDRQLTIRLKHSHTTDTVENFGLVDIFLTEEQALTLINQIMEVIGANKKEEPLTSHTCRRCGQEGKISKAYNYTLVEFPDFPDSKIGDRGNTLLRVGEAQMVDCLKCSNCGHSWIPSTWKF